MVERFLEMEALSVTIVEECTSISLQSGRKDTDLEKKHMSILW